MNLLNHKIEIHNNIFVVVPIKKYNVELTLEELKSIKDILDNTYNKKFEIVMFPNYIGYYKAYNFELDKYIYCMSLSKKTALNLLMEKLNESSGNK